MHVVRGAREGQLCHVLTEARGPVPQILSPATGTVITVPIHGAVARIKGSCDNAEINDRHTGSTL